VTNVEESEYILHINFDEINAEIDKLKRLDRDVFEKITTFLGCLKATVDRIEPTLAKETHDEKELWEDYKQLQREKLAVLDLSHEWDFVEQKTKDVNPTLNLLVKDALEEMSDHINVLSESHRAHIDILEIYNTRKIEFIALLLTAIISYLAVWEFFVRDLLVSVEFPNNLSPVLNYLLVAVTLLPVYVIVSWAWIRRKRYF